jgi:hypothetical protein
LRIDVVFPNAASSIGDAAPPSAPNQTVPPSVVKQAVTNLFKRTTDINKQGVLFPDLVPEVGKVSSVLKVSVSTAAAFLFAATTTAAVCVLPAAAAPLLLSAFLHSC